MKVVHSVATKQQKKQQCSSRWIRSIGNYCRNRRINVVLCIKIILLYFPSAIQESIVTGIDEIDQVVTDSAYTQHLNIGAGTGRYTIKELVYQSADNTYANATTIATVQSWIPSSNTLSVTNIMGEFVDNRTIVGVTSNAQFVLANFDPMNTPSTHENYDNSFINQTSQPIINTTESNPFGGL